MTSPEATENSGAAAKPSEVMPRREVVWVSIDQLELDPANPRLADGLENAKQPQLLEMLAREYELTELGQSLADNGYFSEEPLVVVPAPTASRWRVVEGNRRLAALKLLDDPNGAPKAHRKRWDELSKNRKHIVRDAPILVYERREDVIPYLGFRHITGVLEWKPYQKARYITQLVELASHTFHKLRARLAARPLPSANIMLPTRSCGRLVTHFSSTPPMPKIPSVFCAELCPIRIFETFFL